MLVTVGPVSGDAARRWTTHILKNLAVVRAHAGELPFRFPDDVADAFQALLVEWRDHAADVDEFLWEAEVEGTVARVLVQYWANLDSLTDEHLERMGIDWSPPDARPFFIALAEGVAEAFDRAGEGDVFAQLLALRAEADAARLPEPCGGGPAR